MKQSWTTWTVPDKQNKVEVDMKKIHLLVILSLTLLVGCDRGMNKTAQNLLLVFADQEESVEPYKTRVIVTPDFMRFDYGEGATDFLLFDRKQKTIYSVIQESKSVTVITSNAVDIKPPFDLKLSNKQIHDLKDAPTMDGVKPQHHVYLSGEQVCFEVLSVPGFLPAYVLAMQEFNTILANDSALTLNGMPADMQDGCSLAKDVFAPNRHFQAGFPIQQWGSDGTRTELLEFKKDYQADKTLFEIPAGYNRLNIQDIRSKLSGQPAAQE